MKKGLKLIALVTLVCFLTTQSVWGAPGAGIEMAGQRELPGYLSIDVPAELGTVDALYEAPAGANPQFILHIQNAHANYQAQMKIKQLLGYMNKKYGFTTIFVEGASEKLDADYLRLFPDQERNLKLCDELAKQGELTGAELFLMEQGTESGVRSTEYSEKNSNTPYTLRSTQNAVEALGIEEASLYKANYEALKKVFGAQADVARFFKGFDGKLDKVASQTFTPETRELIADWKRFEEGRRDFMPFVKGLAKKSKKILNVDIESLFAQVGWPQISRLLVIQQLEKDLNKTKGQEEQAMLIKKLRTQSVSKELLATLENFNEGSIAVGKSTVEVSPREVLERLAAEAGPKGFKFSDYPAFSLFAGYVTLRSELDPKVLYEEIEYLFTQMLDTLAKEPQQKALLALYRDGELLRKLLHLELNRKQWRQVLAEKDRVSIASLVSRLQDAVQGVRSTVYGENAATGSAVRLPPYAFRRTNGAVMPKAFGAKMDELFTAGLEFYDFAHKREAVFYKEMQTAMTERKITKAILITGGFHTDGMSDLFRENAVSYGIVTPRLSEKSDENLYQKIMLQNQDYPFSVSYLEAASKLQSWMAQGNQGLIPAKDLEGILAAIMSADKSLKLGQAVGIFNASAAARIIDHKGVKGIALSVTPEKGQDGRPVYKIVARDQVSRVQTGNVLLEAGPITPAMLQAIQSRRTTDPGNLAPPLDAGKIPGNVFQGQVGYEAPSTVRSEVRDFAEIARELVRQSGIKEYQKPGSVMMSKLSIGGMLKQLEVDAGAYGLGERSNVLSWLGLDDTKKYASLKESLQNLQELSKFVERNGSAAQALNVQVAGMDLAALLAGGARVYPGMAGRDGEHGILALTRAQAQKLKDSGQLVEGLKFIGGTQFIEDVTNLASINAKQGNEVVSYYGIDLGLSSRSEARDNVEEMQTLQSLISAREMELRAHMDTFYREESQGLFRRQGFEVTAEGKVSLISYKKLSATRKAEAVVRFLASHPKLFSDIPVNSLDYWSEYFQWPDQIESVKQRPIRQAKAAVRKAERTTELDQWTEVIPDRLKFTPKEKELLKVQRDIVRGELKSFLAVIRGLGDQSASRRMSELNEFELLMKDRYPRDPSRKTLGYARVRIETGDSWDIAALASGHSFAGLYGTTNQKRTPEQWAQYEALSKKIEEIDAYFVRASANRTEVKTVVMSGQKLSQELLEILSSLDDNRELFDSNDYVGFRGRILVEQKRLNALSGTAADVSAVSQGIAELESLIADMKKTRTEAREMEGVAAQLEEWRALNTISQDLMRRVFFNKEQDLRGESDLVYYPIMPDEAAQEGEKGETTQAEAILAKVVELLGAERANDRNVWNSLGNAQADIFYNSLKTIPERIDQLKRNRSVEINEGMTASLEVREDSLAVEFGGNRFYLWRQHGKGQVVNRAGPMDLENDEFYLVRVPRNPTRPFGDVRKVKMGEAQNVGVDSARGSLYYPEGKFPKGVPGFSVWTSARKSALESWKVTVKAFGPQTATVYGVRSDRSPFRAYTDNVIRLLVAMATVYGLNAESRLPVAVGILRGDKRPDVSVDVLQKWNDILQHHPEVIDPAKESMKGPRRTLQGILHDALKGDPALLDQYFGGDLLKPIQIVVRGQDLHAVISEEALRSRSEARGMGKSIEDAFGNFVEIGLDWFLKYINPVNVVEDLVIAATDRTDMRAKSVKAMVLWGALKALNGYEDFRYRISLHRNANDEDFEGERKKARLPEKSQWRTADDLRLLILKDRLRLGQYIRIGARAPLYGVWSVMSRIADLEKELAAVSSSPAPVTAVRSEARNFFSDLVSPTMVRDWLPGAAAASLLLPVFILGMNLIGAAFPSQSYATDPNEVLGIVRGLFAFSSGAIVVTLVGKFLLDSTLGRGRSVSNGLFQVAQTIFDDIAARRYANRRLSVFDRVTLSDHPIREIQRILNARRAQQINREIGEIDSQLNAIPELPENRVKIDALAGRLNELVADAERLQGRSEMRDQELVDLGQRLERLRARSGPSLVLAARQKMPDQLSAVKTSLADLDTAWMAGDQSKVDQFLKLASQQITELDKLETTAGVRIEERQAPAFRTSYVAFAERSKRDWIGYAVEQAREAIAKSPENQLNIALSPDGRKVEIRVASNVRPAVVLEASFVAALNVMPNGDLQIDHYLGGKTLQRVLVPANATFADLKLGSNNIPQEWIRPIVPVVGARSEARAGALDVVVTQQGRIAIRQNLTTQIFSVDPKELQGAAVQLSKFLNGTMASYYRQMNRYAFVAEEGVVKQYPGVGARNEATLLGTFSVTVPGLMAALDSFGMRRAETRQTQVTPIEPTFVPVRSVARSSWQESLVQPIAVVGSFVSGILTFVNVASYEFAKANVEALGGFYGAFAATAGLGIIAGSVVAVAFYGIVKGIYLSGRIALGLPLTPRNRRLSKFEIWLDRVTGITPSPVATELPSVKPLASEATTVAPLAEIPQRRFPTKEEILGTEVVSSKPVEPPTRSEARQGPVVAGDWRATLVNGSLEIRSGDLGIFSVSLKDSAATKKLADFLQSQWLRVSPRSQATFRAGEGKNAMNIATYTGLTPALHSVDDMVWLNGILRAISRSESRSIVAENQALAKEVSKILAPEDQAWLRGNRPEFGMDSLVNVLCGIMVPIDITEGMVQDAALGVAAILSAYAAQMRSGTFEFGKFMTNVQDIITQNPAFAVSNEPGAVVKVMSRLPSAEEFADLGIQLAMNPNLRFHFVIELNERVEAGMPEAEAAIADIQKMSGANNLKIGERLAVSYGKPGQLTANVKTAASNYRDLGAMLGDNVTILVEVPGMAEKLAGVALGAVVDVPKIEPKHASSRNYVAGRFSQLFRQVDSEGAVAQLIKSLGDVRAIVKNGRYFDMDDAALAGLARIWSDMISLAATSKAA